MVLQEDGEEVAVNVLAGSQSELWLWAFGAVLAQKDESVGAFHVLQMVRLQPECIQQDLRRGNSQICHNFENSSIMSLGCSRKFSWSNHYKFLMRQRKDYKLLQETYQHTAGKSSASGALGAITQNKVSLQLATSALYWLKLLWYTTHLVKSHEQNRLFSPAPCSWKWHTPSSISSRTAMGITESLQLALTRPLIPFFDSLKIFSSHIQSYFCLFLFASSLLNISIFLPQ